MEKEQSAQQTENMDSRSPVPGTNAGQEGRDDAQRTKSGSVTEVSGRDEKSEQELIQKG